MLQKVITHYKSRKFLKFFVLGMVLSILGQLLVSYLEYDAIVWPLIVPMLVGDFFSTFAIFDVSKKETREK